MSTLTSISNGLDPYIFFCQKMEKTPSMKRGMDGKVLISPQNRHFSSVNNMIKVVFPICFLNWRVNKFFSHQGKVIRKENESTIFIYI